MTQNNYIQTVRNLKEEIDLKKNKHAYDFITRY